MRTQIARARAHYVRGMDGVARLPADCRLAILLSARLYRAILDEIEAADYDVFTRRAATSTRFKVAEAMRCALLLRHPTRPARARRRVPTGSGWPCRQTGTSDALPLVRS